MYFCATVYDQLTAMVRTVLPLNAVLMTSCMRASVAMSMEAVASSIISTFESLRKALARQKSCKAKLFFLYTGDVEV